MSKKLKESFPTINAPIGELIDTDCALHGIGTNSICKCREILNAAAWKCATPNCGHEGNKHKWWGAHGCLVAGCYCEILTRNGGGVVYDKDITTTDAIRALLIACDAAMRNSEPYDGYIKTMLAQAIEKAKSLGVR